MSKSKKLRICIMPECGGKVRTVHINPLFVPFVIFCLLAVVAGGAFFAYHTQLSLALASVNDRSSELESLRYTNAAQENQLKVFTARVTALDQQIKALKIHEDELKTLAADFSGRLGLEPGAPLNELLKQLNSTVAWANDQKNGVGGSEQLSGVLSSAALAGTSRELIKGMHRDLDRLLVEADDVDHYIAALKDGLTGSSSVLAATPMMLPLEGRRISADFGYRRSPFGGVSTEMHRGLDIPAPMGTAVLSPADGTVLSASHVGGYGLLLAIDHGYGLVTRYGHLSGVVVDVGDQVVRGQQVAKVGNSGRSTGPHLHYETVLGGVTLDPNEMTFRPKNIGSNQVAQIEQPAEKP